MRRPLQSECHNFLLTHMSVEDFKLLAPGLEPVSLMKGVAIAKSDMPFDHVYFPEQGLISIVAISPSGQRAEAGMFGQEGFGPTAAALGSDRTPDEYLIQLDGSAFRVDKAFFASVIRESRTLQDLLLRYVYVFNVQITYTGLSCATHSIDERLARWLLMCHDRNGSDEIFLTHDFLAFMLSVRRPSVTTSLHVLEGMKLIRSDRGRVTIRDRKALEDFANDAYGKPEAEYRRLIRSWNTEVLRPPSMAPPRFELLQ